jgi:hypothetical protein
MSPISPVSLMRSALLLTLFASTAPTAQVFQAATPPPPVTAASESWQLNGEPLFYEGSFYFPTAGTVFFDGNVMTRTGVYRGVPLYQDRTIEPFSVVLVPIGRNLMRAYERRREGSLAGTVGSRVPSFPVQRGADVSDATLEAEGRALLAEVTPLPRAGVVRSPPAAAAVLPAPASAAVGTAGAAPAPPRPTEPRSTGNDGVWIQFDGARWFAAGRAEAFDPERFVPAGAYHGFTVYRERDAPPGTLYVPAVRDGAVTPYTRR